MNLSTFGQQFLIESLLNNRYTTAGLNPIAQAYGITGPTTSIPSLFVSLHSAYDVNGGSEIAIAGYARQAYSRDFVTVSSVNLPPWTNASLSIGGRSVTRYANTTSITFGAVSASATVVAWGLWTAQTGGTHIAGGPLRNPSADVRIGYASTTTNVLCRAHGFAGGETIRLFAAYDNVGGLPDSLSPIASEGIQRTISAAPPTDSFTLTPAISAVGPITFVRDASLALVTGSVPSIPALGLQIYVT